VLGLLAMLEGRRAEPAARALAGLLDSRTLLPAAEVLVRWADVPTLGRGAVSAAPLPNKMSDAL
jgi:hypothetical protein